MNRIQKVLAIAALTASCNVNAAEIKTTEPVKNGPTQAGNTIAKRFDLDQIEQNVKADLTKQFAEMNLREQIQKELDKEADKLVKKQMEMNKEWDNLAAKEKAAWDKYEKLTMKQQLANIMKSFGEPSETKDIWGNSVFMPAQVTIHMDTKNNHIGVYSDDVDAKGRPLKQWELNVETGHITETDRDADGNEVRIHHMEVDPATLERDADVAQLQKELKQKELQAPTPAIEVKTEVDIAENLATTDAAVQEVGLEWEDLEKQRDIAFKIMYFFIVFIIATFCLLYAFFRMTQNEAQQTAVRKGAKGQRVQESSFVDFLAGEMGDENYVVNPYARKHATQISSQFNSASTPFANLASHSYSKAQQLARKAQTAKTNNDKIDHRVNAGFGANNLVHLSNEERGRFDELEFDCEQKPDFTKLSTFSNL